MIRNLLGVLGLILVGVLLWRWRMVRHLVSRPRGPAVAPAYRAELLRPEGRSRVLLVAGGSPEELVNECLERLGAAALLQVAGKNVLVSAHGNSLRSIVMKLDRLTPDEVVALELPTGVPLRYEIGPDGTTLSKEAL